MHHARSIKHSWPNAPAGSRTRGTSMGGLYVAATLQVPLPKAGFYLRLSPGYVPGLGSEADETVCSKKPGGVRGTMGGAFISIGNNVFVRRASVVRDCHIYIYVGLSFQHIP